MGLALRAVGRCSLGPSSVDGEGVTVREHSGCQLEDQPTRLPGEEEQEAPGLPCHRAEVVSLLEGEREELDA